MHNVCIRRHATEREARTLEKAFDRAIYLDVWMRHLHADTYEFSLRTENNMNVPPCKCGSIYL